MAELSNRSQCRRTGARGTAAVGLPEGLPLDTSGNFREMEFFQFSVLCTVVSRSTTSLLTNHFPTLSFAQAPMLRKLTVIAALALVAQSRAESASAVRAFKPLTFYGPSCERARPADRRYRQTVSPRLCGSRKFLHFSCRH